MAIHSYKNTKISWHVKHMQISYYYVKLTFNGQIFRCHKGKNEIAYNIFLQ